MASLAQKGTRYLMRVEEFRMHYVLAALAGGTGFSAVGLGAFGAHALALDERGQKLWSTASQYHLVHAAVIVALAMMARREPQGPWALSICAFAVGAVLFSGSLYALALGAPRQVGAITPLGGLIWLMAWVAVGWGFARQPLG